VRWKRRNALRRFLMRLGVNGKILGVIILMTTGLARAETVVKEAPKPQPSCKAERDAIVVCNRAYEDKKAALDAANKALNECLQQSKELGKEVAEQDKKLSSLSRNPFIMAGAGALVAVNPIVAGIVIIGLIIF
jgi:hypothetical protein